MTLAELGERYWRGEVATREVMRPTRATAEVAPGVWFLHVRNIWRLYGGWYDGVPSHLKPAREADLGREVAGLAGGVGVLVARARSLAEAGDLAVASHLIDWAAAVDADSREVHAARAQIYETRARSVAALMTRGIFAAAARDSAKRAGLPAPQIEGGVG